MRTEGAGTPMMPTDNGGHILAKYGDFVEVFSKAKVETLLPHWSNCHTIDFKPSYILPYGQF
jgi:hypothetical protein